LLTITSKKLIHVQQDIDAHFFITMLSGYFYKLISNINNIKGKKINGTIFIENFCSEINKCYLNRHTLK
jgi:hypothetical protein